MSFSKDGYIHITWPYHFREVTGDYARRGILPKLRNTADEWNKEFDESEWDDGSVEPRWKGGDKAAGGIITTETIINSDMIEDFAIESRHLSRELREAMQRKYEHQITNDLQLNFLNAASLNVSAGASVGSLSVTSGASVGGDLHVSGNVVIDGSLEFEIVVNDVETLNVTSNATIGNNLSVGNDVTIDQDLMVIRDAEIGKFLKIGRESIGVDDSPRLVLYNNQGARSTIHNPVHIDSYLCLANSETASTATNSFAGWGVQIAGRQTFRDLNGNNNNLNAHYEIDLLCDNYWTIGTQVGNTGDFAAVFSINREDYSKLRFPLRIGQDFTETEGGALLQLWNNKTDLGDTSRGGTTSGLTGNPVSIEYYLNMSSTSATIPQIAGREMVRDVNPTDTLRNARYELQVACQNDASSTATMITALSIDRLSGLQTPFNAIVGGTLTVAGSLNVTGAGDFTGTVNMRNDVTVNGDLSLYNGKVVFDRHTNEVDASGSVGFIPFGVSGLTAYVNSQTGFSMGNGHNFNALMPQNCILFDINTSASVTEFTIPQLMRANYHIQLIDYNTSDAVTMGRINLPQLSSTWQIGMQLDFFIQNYRSIADKTLEFSAYTSSNLTQANLIRSLLESLTDNTCTTDLAVLGAYTNKLQIRACRGANSTYYWQIL